MANPADTKDTVCLTEMDRKFRVNGDLKTLQEPS